MALKRIEVPAAKKTNENGDDVEFTPLGTGEYEGRLVYVADLGLQERTFAGETKPPAQQLSLGIEIVGHQNGGQPRFLWTRPFNIFSKMDEKSNEYKFYKVFDTNAQPDTVADWDEVLGAPCTVKVASVPGKGANAGKVFDNISDLIPIPEKYRKDVQANELEPAIGDADDDTNPATKALYGLAKWKWEQRITQPVKTSPKPRKGRETVLVDEESPY